MAFLYLMLFKFLLILPIHSNSAYTIPEVRSASNIIGGLADERMHDEDLMDDGAGGDDEAEEEEDNTEWNEEEISRQFEEARASSFAAAEAVLRETAEFLRSSEGPFGQSASSQATTTSAAAAASASAPAVAGQSQPKNEEDEKMETSPSAPPPPPAKKEVKPPRDEAIDALYSDSEGEFADAVSDFPTATSSAANTASTSAPAKPPPTPVASVASATAATTTGTGATGTASDVPPNWQSVLPNEWVSGGFLEFRSFQSLMVCLGWGRRFPSLRRTFSASAARWKLLLLLLLFSPSRLKVRPSSATPTSTACPRSADWSTSPRRRRRRGRRRRWATPSSSALTIRFRWWYKSLCTNLCVETLALTWLTEVCCRFFLPSFLPI